jgi:hypothetical protein
MSTIRNASLFHMPPQSKRPTRGALRVRQGAMGRDSRPHRRATHQRRVFPQARERDTVPAPKIMILVPIGVKPHREAARSNNASRSVLPFRPIYLHGNTGV